MPVSKIPGAGISGGSVTVSQTAPDNSLVITSGGQVNTPNNPAFFVYGGSSTNFSSASGAQYSPAAAYINNGNCFNLTTSTFTAPIAGIYNFGGMIRVDAATYYIYTSPVLNGSTTNWLSGSPLPGLTTYNASNNVFAATSLSWLMNLNAGDTVKLNAYLGNTVTANFNSQSFWTGYLVG